PGADRAAGDREEPVPERRPPRFVGRGVSRHYTQGETQGGSAGGGIPPLGIRGYAAGSRKSPGPWPLPTTTPSGRSSLACRAAAACRQRSWPFPKASSSSPLPWCATTSPPTISALTPSPSRAAPTWSAGPSATANTSATPSPWLRRRSPELFPGTVFSRDALRYRARRVVVSDRDTVTQASCSRPFFNGLGRIRDTVLLASRTDNL